MFSSEKSVTGLGPVAPRMLAEPAEAHTMQKTIRPYVESRKTLQLLLLVLQIAKLILDL